VGDAPVFGLEEVFGQRAGIPSGVKYNTQAALGEAAVVSLSDGGSTPLTSTIIVK